jgi:hypothetical protein
MIKINQAAKNINLTWLKRSLVLALVDARAGYINRYAPKSGIGNANR